MRLLTLKDEGISSNVPVVAKSHDPTGRGPVLSRLALFLFLIGLGLTGGPSLFPLFRVEILGAIHLHLFLLRDRRPHISYRMVSEYRSDSTCPGG